MFSLLSQSRDKRLSQVLGGAFALGSLLLVPGWFFLLVLLSVLEGDHVVGVRRLAGPLLLRRKRIELYLLPLLLGKRGWCRAN